HCGAAGSSYISLGHSDATQWGIGVERICGDAVRYPALLVIESIRRHDLEIDVGRVREGTAAVAIAQSPDSRHICQELFVHFEEAASVHGNPGVLKAEVVSYRTATDCQE